MAASTFGTKNQPHFAEADGPDIAANPTQVADYAAQVGNRRADTSAVRTGLTGADVWDGLEFYETDTGLTYVYKGGWVASGQMSSLVNGTASVSPVGIQWGIFKVTGSGGAALSAPINFPRAFAAVPAVSASVMGYKATGVYAPTGLSFATETAAGQQTTASSVQIYLHSATTLATTSDYYISWIAAGQF